MIDAYREKIFIAVLENGRFSIYSDYKDKQPEFDTFLVIDEYFASYDAHWNPDTGEITKR